MDPYKVLEIERTSTLGEIKRAYRRLSRKHHPDKGGSDEMMAQVNLAYEILKDPDSRDLFDRTGNIHQGPSFEDVARSRILTIFIDSAKKHRWQKGNYVEAIRKALNQDAHKLKSKHGELTDVCSLMGTMIPEHHEGDSDNMFVGAIRGQQAMIEGDLEKIVFEQQVIKAAIELLKPYTDNLPPQEFANQFFFTSSTATSTGGF